MFKDFDRIAIVNRGEPAMRLIHAVRELNGDDDRAMRTIALYTEPDRNAMFVREADEAYDLGSATFVDERDGQRKVRYLDYDALERALRETRADAVWVGWGFVSEHADFADLCERLGIVFVGPSGDVMRRLGDKITSKQCAEEASVPVAPWSGGPVESLEDARRHAENLDYPLMVKATAGGGGRGIRKVTSPDKLAEAFESARAEALAGFGNATVFIERMLPSARHIEVQVIADRHGHAWALGVRDCTLQRRHQKLLEESPSPALTDEQERELCDAAVRLVSLVGYQNAGTVEFLYDEATQIFSFMEVNARLQVEHPVTEMCTGVDLVKLQLRVARGEALEGDAPPRVGHAIEVRVNAENPDDAFSPSPGLVELLQLPTGPGIRVDRGVAEGDSVPPEFDSMIAKFIAHGRDRKEALSRLHRALSEAGVVIRDGMSNKGFLLQLLKRAEVREGSYDVGWLDRLVVEGTHVTDEHADVAMLMGAVVAYEDELEVEREQFFAAAGRGRPEIKGTIERKVELGYRSQSYSLDVSKLGPLHYRVVVEGVTIEATLAPIARSEWRVQVGRETFRVLSALHGVIHTIEVNGVPHRITRDEAGAIRAPSPAVVVSIDVAPGDVVQPGDRLAVLEAMKMEMAVTAPFAGTVREVCVRSNIQVPTGTVLMMLEPEDDQDSVHDAPRLSFAALQAPEPGDATAACQQALDDARSLLLGYDVDPRVQNKGIAKRGGLCVDMPADDAALRAAETDLLEIFVDQLALYRRRPSAPDEDLGMQHSSEEHLFTYLRDIDARGAKLPPRFVAKLERTLAHYGIDSLDPSPELRESLFRMSKSHQRMNQQELTVLSVLQRRLQERDALLGELGDDWGRLLDDLIREAQGHYPSVHDLARQLHYAYLTQPVLETAQREHYARANDDLAYLAEHPGGPEREARIQSLVDCPHSLKSKLAHRMVDAPNELQRDMIEAIFRRYYRIRSLRDVAGVDADGLAVVTATYEHDGKTIRALSTYCTMDDLESAATTLARQMEGAPDDADLVADFYVWREGPLSDVDETVGHLEQMMSGIAWPRPVRRIVVAISCSEQSASIGGTQHVTLRADDEGSYRESALFRGVLHRALHPMMAKRLRLWRFENFEIERLPSIDDVYLLRGVARDNPSDERLFGVAEVRDLTPVRDEDGKLVSVPHFEHVLVEVLTGLRRIQAGRSRRLHWNRVMLYVWPTVTFTFAELEAAAMRLAPLTSHLGLEAFEVLAKFGEGGEERRIKLTNVADAGLETLIEEPPTQPLEPIGRYDFNVVRARRRGLVYPYELVRLLAPTPDTAQPGIPPGTFTEYDLDEENRLVPVDRPFGSNLANIVVGIVKSVTDKHPEGMERVVLLGDPTSGMGNLAETECRLIIEGLNLAEERGIPLEWFAVSAGARIAMDSGTENMDWISAVLKRLITFTQAGGEVNILIVGINVGAQPYWNAEATMLMHTRGILVMTAQAAMVLTGKQALDFSGGVSADDNFGIGGYERIMGPNGQAQYFANDVPDACRLLYRYYDLTYRVPGERFPRVAPTVDPVDRDVGPFPHPPMEGIGFTTVGQIFSDEHNGERKKPFDMRTVMRAVSDQDHEPLERWRAMQDAEIAIVWDAHVGGHPVTLLGLESRPVSRLGFIPADGPSGWTGGTLFPRSSKKVARAVNAASGNRPLVVLANLSGFDGSPESMRSWQLEYGAEIGRAVVNFDGPIVFCVVSRYHGGAFVVFSNALNDNMEIAALEGTRASVIGGAPAAAVVFAREVKKRATTDPRVKEAKAALDAAQGPDRLGLQARYSELFDEVHSEKLGEVAEEFDTIHSVQRALEVGSVHRIIDPSTLRPYLVDAIERGKKRIVEPG